MIYYLHFTFYNPCLTASSRKHPFSLLLSSHSLQSKGVMLSLLLRRKMMELLMQFILCYEDRFTIMHTHREKSIQEECTRGDRWDNGKCCWRACAKISNDRWSSPKDCMASEKSSRVLLPLNLLAQRGAPPPEMFQGFWNSYHQSLSHNPWIWALHLESQ